MLACSGSTLDTVAKTLKTILLELAYSAKTLGHSRTTLKTVTHTDPQTQLIHRGPSDMHVWQEQKTYSALKAEGKIVLDIGGHIGCFAKYACETLGAKEVISIEPDPRNIEFFKLNHSKHSRIELMEGALTSDCDPLVRGTIELQQAEKYSSKNRTDRPIRGRSTVTVDAINFRTLLENKKVEVIKCDIEGAEYLLDWDYLPERVTGIAIEYHHFDPDQLEKQHALHNNFLSQGFKPIVLGKVEEGVQFWKITTTIYGR